MRVAARKKNAAAYVGVTRAMQKLTLTYAETRRLYGKEVYHRPSRFIGELPESCVEEVRLRATVSRPVSHQRMGTPMAENDTGYKLGQRVRHAKFGEGTIVNSKAAANTAACRLRFRGRGLNGWSRRMPGLKQCNSKKKYHYFVIFCYLYTLRSLICSLAFRCVLTPFLRWRNMRARLR